MRLLIVLILLQVQILPDTSNYVNLLEERIEQQSIEIQEINHSIGILEDRQELLGQKTNALVDIIEVSNGSISNSLSSTSLLLIILSVIFGVVAAGLAIYVTYLERKTKSLKDAVTETSKVVKEKETEVKALVNDINDNIDKLYQKVRREDTKSMLKRLVEVPDDISNLLDILLSRELESEDFVTIKEAYQNLINKGREKDCLGYFRQSLGDEYLLLFFQHFPAMAIEDDFIGNKIIGYFKTGIACAFENDVLNIINEIGGVVSNKNTKANRSNVLYELLLALKTADNTKDNPKYIEMLKIKVNDDSIWDEVEHKIDIEMKKS